MQLSDYQKSLNCNCISLEIPSLSDIILFGRLKFRISDLTSYTKHLLRLTKRVLIGYLLACPPSLKECLAFYFSLFYSGKLTHCNLAF